MTDGNGTMADGSVAMDVGGAPDGAGRGDTAEVRWRTWGGVHGPLFDPALDPARTALVVIDLQYLYHRDFGIGARLQALGTFSTHAYMFDRLDTLVLPNVRRLLDACRSAGVRVLYTRNCAQAPDGADAPASWRRPGRVEGVNWCVAGSKEAEIIEEVRPHDNDIVVDKTSSGAFASTALDTLLRNLGVTTLLFCGVATNYCVETSVRGANDRGYEAVLVSDACAARTAEQERWAWEVLDGIYCRVLGTDDVLARLPAGVAVRRAG